MSRSRKRQHDSNLHASGMITKEALACGLLDVRRHAGLRQTDLARRAESTRSVVSRLESIEGRLPDLTTLARYGRACLLDVGLVFGTPRSDKITIHSAITVQSEKHDKIYELLFGEDIVAIGPEQFSAGGSRRGSE